MHRMSIVPSLYGLAAMGTVMGLLLGYFAYLSDLSGASFEEVPEDGQAHLREWTGDTG